MSKKIEMFSPQKNIDDMSYDELRAFVKKFYNLFERFKREYMDTLENLDESNFSGQFLKEQNGMKAKITATAEKIESTVSKVDLENSLEEYTKIEQTADAISMLASKGADISKAKVIRDYDTLCLEGDPYYVYVIQEKDEDGNVIKETYYYYNDLSEKWEAFSGDSIYTVFEQTPEGFNLKGNVVIDGNTVVTKNLVLSGNVTWDMDNSPVKTQYSTDKTSWHEEIQDSDLYMRMSFDGGQSWSTSTKVVGTDGKNGYNGSDANVTPENVFNALTDDGATQGIFAAFVNNNNQLYINAEYLATKIADVADYIYIGEPGDNATKRITFSSGANISTYADWTGNPPTGMRISASTLDLSSCSNIEWGNNAPVAVFGGD